MIFINRAPSNRPMVFEEAKHGGSVDLRVGITGNATVHRDDRGIEV